MKRLKIIKCWHSSKLTVWSRWLYIFRGYKLDFHDNNRTSKSCRIYVADSEKKCATVYSIIMSSRTESSLLWKKFSLCSCTTTVLTETLVLYELTVSSETKINTMDTLGEGYISQSVGVHIKKGGKIATVCKLTNNLPHFTYRKFCTRD